MTNSIIIFVCVGQYNSTVIRYKKCRLLNRYLVLVTHYPIRPHCLQRTIRNHHRFPLIKPLIGRSSIIDLFKQRFRRALEKNLHKGNLATIALSLLTKL